MRYLFLQICKGVHSLHTDAQLAHLDLKLENTLIGNDGLLRICDFGMANSVDELLRKPSGTKFYCGPEVHMSSEFRPYSGVPADIFGLGVILFILAFGAPPFNMATNSDANYRILTRSPEKFWQNHPNVKKSKRGGLALDSDLSNLLTSMMAQNPQNRPENI